jgi:hypothetical protein
MWRARGQGRGTWLLIGEDSGTKVGLSARPSRPELMVCTARSERAQLRSNTWRIASTDVQASV